MSSLSNLYAVVRPIDNYQLEQCIEPDLDSSSRFITPSTISKSPASSNAEYTKLKLFIS